MTEKKVVLVQFGDVVPGGKEYAYLSRFDHIVGQVIAVETPRQLAIVTVTKVDNISSEAASYASKWVVDIIDVTGHKEFKETLNNG